MQNRCVPTIFDQLAEEFIPLSQFWDRAMQRAVPNSFAQNGMSIGETEDMVFVDLPIPGVSKEKIQISYEKGSLLVNAEEEEEEKGVKYHTKSSRKYSYRIPVPARIDEQTAPEATYKNGILRVNFHKSRGSRPVKIDIKSG